MKSQFSRRDFLKLGGLTLGGLAFSPFLPGLTDFDDSFVVRIATDEMPVRAEPTDESRIYQTWYRDDLVHVYEQVIAEEPKHNPVWYRVWGGYLHRGRLQRVKTIYQTPVEIPEGTAISYRGHCPIYHAISIFQISRLGTTDSANLLWFGSLGGWLGRRPQDDRLHGRMVSHL